MTDHQNLQYLFASANVSGRLGRWVLYLQGLRFKIQHVKGSTLVDADCLSRICRVKDDRYGVVDTPAVAEWKGQQPAALLDACSKTVSLLEIEGVWYAVVHGRRVPVVPEAARASLMAAVHQQCAHQGTATTLARLQRVAYWPGMRVSVKQYVKSCLTCARLKPSRPTHHGVEWREGSR